MGSVKLVNPSDPAISCQSGANKLEVFCNLLMTLFQLSVMLLPFLKMLRNRGGSVGMLYSPKSSIPQYQLEVPVCRKRNRTLARPSAMGKRNNSTRFDSTASSLTRPLMKGASA